MHITPSKFESFELEHSLFDLRIDDIPIWERLRFNVFRQITHQSGTGLAHTSPGHDWRNYVHVINLFLRNFVIKNPYLASGSDVLYVGHERRKKRDDGYWWDIYCDPIHEACNHDYVHFEKPHLLDHLRPARTSDLRYLDLIEYGGAIQRRLGMNKPTIPSTKREQLKDAEIAIKAEFDASINLVEDAIYNLHMRKTRLGLYKRLLRRLDPELLILVVSYGEETLIEACKELDIPVAELQHGVIYEHHFGYSYPGLRTKEMFPDYLLTFGDFWIDSVEFPIPNDRIISVGYPYLEESINKYDDINTKDQLLFISQGTIGEELSKFAMNVNQHPEIEYDIVYKLHPGEYDRWQTEYPWLLEADFEVVDNSDRQLYKLFTESSAQIGVGSTAVYEGLAFGLETYVYDCRGSEVLQPLVDERSASFVSCADDLASSLGSGDSTFDREYYFTPNATERVCDVIDQLTDEGTSYSISTL